MRQFVRNDKDFKRMNSYRLGKLVLNWIYNYLEDFEQCDKIKSFIDFQFDEYTEAYFYKVITFYVLAFIVPYYVQLFGELEGKSA